MIILRGLGEEKRESVGLDARQEILHGLMDLFEFKASYQAESTGLRAPDIHLLERLRDTRALSTLELARRCGLAPATAVAALDRLQALQLVRRTRDRKDRRVVKVSLSPAGKALVERHLAEDAAFMANLMALLPDDEARTLEALLAKLIASALTSRMTLFDTTDQSLPAVGDRESANRKTACKEVFKRDE